MKYHVFLSHNSKDKAAVRKIYERLEVAGVAAFFDERSGVPGQSWMDLPQAVNDSDSIAFFHGGAGPSPYFMQELSFAVQRQGEMAHESGQPEAVFTMIPVLIHDADDKALIEARKKHPRLRWIGDRFAVDLRDGPRFEEQFQRFVDAIRSSSVVSKPVFQLKNGRLSMGNQPPPRDVPADLVNLCDRRIQADQVSDVVDKACKSTRCSPRVLVIEGQREQSLLRFVDRLRFDTLPSCLPGKSVEEIFHEFPDLEESEDRFGIVALRRFSEAIDQTSTLSMEQCIERLNQRRSCIVVRSSFPLCGKWGTREDKGLVRFIEFYGHPAFERLQELMVVCLCVEAPETKSSRSIFDVVRSWFGTTSPLTISKQELENFLKTPFGKEHVVRLPELRDVKTSDVDQWLLRPRVQEYCPRLADKPDLRATLESWPERDGLRAVPMRRAVEDLERLLTNCCS